VKLLLDENLPHRLVSTLVAEFPGSSHVSEVGLSSSSDEELWRYASEHGFTIVSKDSDFHQMSFLRKLFGFEGATAPFEKSRHWSSPAPTSCASSLPQKTHQFC